MEGGLYLDGQDSWLPCSSSNNACFLPFLSSYVKQSCIRSIITTEINNSFNSSNNLPTYALPIVSDPMARFLSFTVYLVL